VNADLFCSDTIYYCFNSEGSLDSGQKTAGKFDWHQTFAFGLQYEDVSIKLLRCQATNSFLKPITPK